MRTRFTFFLLLILTAKANAQQTWPPYPGKVPNAKDCPDNEVQEKTGRKVVRNVTRPTLSVFLPDQQNASGAAVIISPGGGYSSLSIQDEGFDAARQFAQYGVVAFVLKYRTSNPDCNTNNSIVPLQDLQQAIYTVRSQASKWHVNPDNVGLLGFSAGGHLSALGAIKYQQPQIDSKGISLKPAFTMLAYPVISFTDALTSKKSETRKKLVGAHATADQIKWFSAELNVDAYTPPSFLIQASDDSTSLVENSIAYYNALHKFKVPAKMIIYQRGGHGFGTYNKVEDDHWLKYAVDWMKLNAFLK